MQATIEEAFDSQHNIFDLNIEQELMTILEERNLFNDEHAIESLYSNHNITADDVEASLKDFDPALYICESNKLQSLLNDKLSQLKITNVDYDFQCERVDTLTQVIQTLDHHFDTSTPALIESKKLLQTHTEERDEIRKRVVNKMKELHLLHKHTPHFTKNDPRNICSICIRNEVDTANYPCGHTMCNTCAFTLPTRHCFFCRTEVQNIIKLYFN